jgi:hypothetical protein
MVQNGERKTEWNKNKGKQGGAEQELKGTGG